MMISKLPSGRNYIRVLTVMYETFMHSLPPPCTRHATGTQHILRIKREATRTSILECIVRVKNARTQNVTAYERPTVRPTNLNTPKDGREGRNML
jgi:hypothetical protein